ncbi:MAG: hypothetical protein RMJ52_13310 [Gemmataceae bacterium]|nr:hypothetical protein [Gemmataceae bacterium]
MTAHGGPTMLAMLDLGMLILKVLAVVGGAAVGGWLAAIVAQTATGPLVRQLPRWLDRCVRLTGAGLLGGLVYLWVFGSGSGGIGGSGSGYWPFGAGGQAGGTAVTPPTQPASPPSSPSPEPLRITMRGGREAEADQRFYHVSERGALTISELTAELQRRSPPPVYVEIIIEQRSVDRDSPAVAALRQALRERHLEVRLIER